MDPNRFDTIARRLGTEHSRRGMLKTLAAAALGALGVATASRATAAASGSNSACDAFCHAVFGDTRAAGKCTSDAAHGNPNGLCARCSANPANYCNGVCKDTSSDLNNCGGCGNVCTGTSCSNGQCQCPTPGPGSTYGAPMSCQEFSRTCDAGVTTLKAYCLTNGGSPTVTTSIDVNSCASANYVISNCNGYLTCGNCS